MSRGRQKVSFEGLMHKNVLGTFKIIRGFADLKDLADVSTAIPYQPGKDRSAIGYQRKVDDIHVEDIKRFLEKGRYRFFPEIVLGLRSSGPNDPVVSYGKRRSSEKDKAYWISVSLKALREDNYSRIHRIDGNHRLEAAKLVLSDSKEATAFKNFATAPFCFVILDSDRPQDDDLAEAMLFNLINSKALPITSEHSLSVLMQDDGASNERFVEDPQIYLTRWMKDKIQGWPNGFYDAMGNTPLSRLHSTAAVFLRPPSGITKETETGMQRQAAQLFNPLYELAIRLRDEHETFVHSYAFLPIAAEVYSHHSKVESSQGANTEHERILRSERLLFEFAQWFDRISGADLPENADPVLLWTVFKRDLDRRSGKVFVAMSFTDEHALANVGTAIREAIDHFNDEHPHSCLAPRRVDEQRGESYEIPARIFSEIDESRLVIADLTDEKPNVYLEVGYAKSRGIPFILTFQKRAGGKEAPWNRESSPGNRVHFDLAPFRRIEYADTMELRESLKQELEAFFQGSVFL